MTKKFSLGKAGTIFGIVAVVFTILIHFLSVQERIAKLEEYKESVMDKLDVKLNKLETQLNEQSDRISWLEGFIRAYTKLNKESRNNNFDEERKK